MKRIPYIEAAINDLAPLTILDYGCGQSDLLDQLVLKNPATKVRYDPAIPLHSEQPGGPFDLVICINVLEHVREGDIDDILADLARLGRHAIIIVDTIPAHTILPNGENAHATVHPPEWWRERLSAHFPKLFPFSVDKEWRASFRTWRCRTERPRILNVIKPLIVNLRRGIDIDNSWRSLRDVIEGDTAGVCRWLNTRWLVSVCDTYADFGSPIERRNAMIISTLVNMEKVAQSFLNWRVNYDGPFDVPRKQRWINLWDGMTSMHLTLGDVTNNMFRRQEALLSESPHLFEIFKVVQDRIRSHPTILGTINRGHKHVFETDTKWWDDPAYDSAREAGILPVKR